MYHIMMTSFNASKYVAKSCTVSWMVLSAGAKKIGKHMPLFEPCGLFNKSKGEDRQNSFTVRYGGDVHMAEFISNSSVPAPDELVPARNIDHQCIAKTMYIMER